MRVLEEVPSNRLGETEALVPSDTIYSGVLSTTEQVVSVPEGADFVQFKSEGGAGFVVNYDRAASTPAGSIGEKGGELNPEWRCVTEVNTLHLASTSASINISLIFYSKRD